MTCDSLYVSETMTRPAFVRTNHTESHRRELELGARFFNDQRGGVVWAGFPVDRALCLRRHWQAKQLLRVASGGCGDFVLGDAPRFGEAGGGQSDVCGFVALAAKRRG